MTRARLFCLSVALWGLCCVRPLSAAIDQPARLVPDSALIYVELTQTGPLLDKALDPALENLLRQSDQAQAFYNSEQFRQLQAVVSLLEQRLSVKWADAVRDIYGSVHVAFNPGTNSGLFIVRSRKPELLAKLHEERIKLVEVDAATHGRPAPIKSQDYQGVKTWTSGPNAFHALVDDVVIASNNSAGLQAALDRQRDKSLKSLVDTPDYQQARGLVESG